MIDLISKLAIPALVFLVVIYAFFKKNDVYENFIEGSKESFKMVYNLFPTLLAMILGINILLESNLLNYLADFIQKFINIPTEIVPLALLRPISGSSALAILNNIYLTHGPDSYVGRLASVIQGSTETTFYVLSLYFSVVGIKKIKYALKVGLIADFLGIVMSFLIVKLFFT
ncbi:MAG: spore maturation protein [Bacilli bacterium]|nr:spore maturation protein [Bacilli bacterium]